MYTLDPETWVWTKVNAAEGNSVNPGSQNSRGTFVRFRYIPSKNAYVVVKRTNENVFIYRLTE